MESCADLGASLHCGEAAVPREVVFLEGLGLFRRQRSRKVARIDIRAWPIRALDVWFGHHYGVPVIDSSFPAISPRSAPRRWRARCFRTRTAAGVRPSFAAMSSVEISL